MAPAGIAMVTLSRLDPIFYWASISCSGNLVQPAEDCKRGAPFLTFPNREKREARLCTYLGVAHSLPLQRRCQVFYLDGPSLRAQLLFSHLFSISVTGGDTSRELLGTVTVVKVTPVPPEPALLAELRPVAAAVDAEADLATAPPRRPGERVRGVRRQLSSVESLVARRGAGRLRRRRERAPPRVDPAVWVGVGGSVRQDNMGFVYAKRGDQRDCSD